MFPGVLVKFGSHTVLWCLFGALCLSIVWTYVKSNCQIWRFSANQLSYFLDCLVSSTWPKLFNRWLYLSIQILLTPLIGLTLQCALVPVTVSALSYSHVLMDGEELDDTRYICCQGCWSPQFHIGNRITTMECVQDFSKQQDALSSTL